MPPTKNTYDWPALARFYAEHNLQPDRKLSTSQWNQLEARKPLLDPSTKSKLVQENVQRLVKSRLVPSQLPLAFEQHHGVWRWKEGALTLLDRYVTTLDHKYCGKPSVVLKCWSEGEGAGNADEQRGLAGEEEEEEEEEEDSDDQQNTITAREDESDDADADRLRQLNEQMGKRVIEETTRADAKAKELEDVLTLLDGMKESARIAEEGRKAAEKRASKAEKDLKSSRSELETELIRADKRADVAREAHAAEERAKDAEERAQDAEERADAAKQRADAAEERAKDAKERADAAEKRASTTGKQLAGVQKKVSNLQEQLTKAEKRADTTTKRTQTAEERASTTDKQLADKVKEVLHLREELTKAEDTEHKLRKDVRILKKDLVDANSRAPIALQRNQQLSSTLLLKTKLALAEERADTAEKKLRTTLASSSSNNVQEAAELKKVKEKLEISNAVTFNILEFAEELVLRYAKDSDKFLLPRGVISVVGECLFDHFTPFTERGRRFRLDEEVVKVKDVREFAHENFAKAVKEVQLKGGKGYEVCARARALNVVGLLCLCWIWQSE